MTNEVKRLLEQIHTALLANGGGNTNFDRGNCGCEPEIGYFCQYCAIQIALEDARSYLLSHCHEFLSEEQKQNVLRWFKPVQFRALSLGMSCYRLLADCTYIKIDYDTVFGMPSSCDPGERVGPIKGDEIVWVSKDSFLEYT